MSGWEFKKRTSDSYLLMTGAPGSRWSGVANSIYASRDFDHTDSSDERSYSHHNGLVHGGAYFDPEMEFEFRKDRWDCPFSGEGVRLIKSHTLADRLPNYRKYNIVMVYRNSWDCWEWWNECGGFDIAYPSYKWYRNQDRMYEQIQLQNQGIMRFIYNYRENVTECADNYEVLTTLGMNFTGVKIEEYKEKDLKVYVYQPSH